MATKKGQGKSKQSQTSVKSKQKEKKEAGDPITIGGGSGLGDERKGREAAEFTYISFDPGVYVEDANYPPHNNKKRRFSRAGSSIASLELDTGTSTIGLKSEEPEIHCQKKIERIKIYGNPIGVEFSTDEYDENPPGSGYYTKVTSIDSVDLKGGSLKRNKSFSWTFTAKR